MLTANHDIDIKASINNYFKLTAKQRKICSWVQFFIGRLAMRRFSTGAIFNIAMKVGVYGPCSLVRFSNDFVYFLLMNMILTVPYYRLG